MKKQVENKINRLQVTPCGTSSASATAAMGDKPASVSLAEEIIQPDEQESSGFTVFADEEGRLGIVFEKESGLGQDVFLEAYAELQKLNLEILRNERQLRLSIVEDEPEKEPREENRNWWAEELSCSSCNEMIRLDQEPDSYVIFCPHCGGAVILEPEECSLAGS
jgi:predicted RNA-binding Zn-ribbon protein involved in translation (DUF1610 family)